LYGKDEMGDLTQDEKRQLKKVIQAAKAARGVQEKEEER
jgi:hypothetical protein